MNPPRGALQSTLWRGVDIHIYDTGAQSPLSLEDALAVLSEDEHARAARFHFATDRERWTRCRALLRMVLGARLGEAAAEIRFRHEESGKPQLEAGPGSGLEFNLSHSGSLLALALGRTPVGVDIEYWKDTLPVHEVSAHAFRPEEHQAIVSHRDPQQHFLSLWTAKEAVMKCTGQGLSLPPASVIVSTENGTAMVEGTGERFALHSVIHPGMWVLTAAQRA
jgi:4'-phosphopantetheinyl transferase